MLHDVSVLVWRTESITFISRFTDHVEDLRRVLSIFLWRVWSATKNNVIERTYARSWWRSNLIFQIEYAYIVKVFTLYRAFIMIKRVIFIWVRVESLPSSFLRAWLILIKVNLFISLLATEFKGSFVLIVQENLFDSWGASWAFLRRYSLDRDRVTRAKHFISFQEIKIFPLKLLEFKL